MKCHTEASILFQYTVVCTAIPEAIIQIFNPSHGRHNVMNIMVYNGMNIRGMKKGSKL